MLILHPSNPETVTFTSGPVAARNKEYVGLFVNITAITGASAAMIVKLQESTDGIDWVDVPTFATSSLTATGAVRVPAPTIGLKCADFVRAVCTISGTTPSITFTANLATVNHGMI